MQRATAEGLLERLPNLRPGLRVVPNDGQSAPQLYPDGQIAFRELLAAVDGAQELIQIRAFVWRDDETGNMLASAILRAANRGVRIEIQKDRIGANYEYFGGNHQSFFHKRFDFTQLLQTLFLHTSYRGTAGPIRQRANVLAQAMLKHPGIQIHHEEKIFDHSKLYVFDRSRIILGGMGIGDEHRNEWFDVMVSVESRELVARLGTRLSGATSFDRGRSADFLVHDRRAAGYRNQCSMLANRLALIDSAETSLTVAMAYLGDPRFTHALARAVRRGVQLTLLTSAKADILGSLNRSTCDRLLRETDAPSHLKVVLLPRMVHAKLMVVDHLLCDVGSANFTPLSHGVYNEVDLYFRNPGLAAALEQAVNERLSEGEHAATRVTYSRVYDLVERSIVTYQSRNGA